MESMTPVAPDGTALADSNGIKIQGSITATGGGGTQYADGAAVATPTGTQVTWNDSGTQRAASPTKPLPVNPASGAAVALSSPAAALTLSTDTTFTFGSQIKHLLVQNNSATAVGVEFDAAATAGSLQVPAGGGALILDIPVTAVHMYSAAATNVNGSSGSNIILKGWS